MAIHESGEDYLEAILMIKKRNGNVRSIDIAHELSFSKPSVSVAMKSHDLIIVRSAQFHVYSYQEFIGGCLQRN